MEDLKKDNFYIHGEDFGAVIARVMALMNPDKVKAIHVTMLNHASPKSEEDIEKGNKEEEESLKAAERYNNELSGYSTLQSTKPQDIAYSVSDSPSGLLAWIYSQFLSWSGKGTKISDEEIIDTAMIYWIYNTMPSSTRYYKLFSEWGQEPTKNDVPTFVLSTPYDIGIPIKRLAEKTDNIKGWTKTKKGGHFIAHEIPEILVESLLSMKKDMKK